MELGKHEELHPVAAQMPTLRPTNYIRNIFHIMNAVVGVVSYEYFLNHTAAVAVMAGILMWLVKETKER